MEFRLFFPDNQVDPQQYSRGGNPRITRIRVPGDFQSKIGGVDWDFRTAPLLQKQAHPNGWLYTHRIDQIPDGFYQYKYFVEFEDGTTRWCGDPCTKYGGSTNQNGAFVVGGNNTQVIPIDTRLSLKDLIIYELMPDDFTAEFRGDKAPLEAISDKIEYLKSLGINAVEFMPLTAWPSDDFSWGYNPALFFSVEHRYTNSPATPLDKLFKLQTLINDLHASGIHVIMDGVFNHAEAKDTPGGGFPYYWLYENPTESPFVGNFAGTGYFEDLDYSNNCTEQFIRDVCTYWLDVFQFDGIRFDYVLGFYRKANVPVGISELITDLKDHMANSGRQNVSFTLEMLTDNRFEAIGKTNEIGASGCWFDPFLWEGFSIVESGNIQTSLVRRLNSGKDFDADKLPVTYGENHDHSTLTEHAGGRDNRWWRTQPIAIALFTCCGAVMIHNGQEFGDQYWLPEEGGGRIMPRPLRWAKSNDPIGNSLRQLYEKLARIRKAHPALRSSNFYPEPYDELQRHFNSQGYGVNVDQDVAIYHRWGSDEAGRLERFIIVLNFSDFAQGVDIPFSDNGDWEDLLNGGTVRIESYWLSGEALSSNWGRIYFKLS